MKIISMREYQGRNIYSHKPVVKMTVDLGYLKNTLTKELAGFNERLLQLFPGLYNHFCSPGYAGGFIDRLQEGTLVSHVTEHLAIELQCMMGYDVYFGKTRVIEEPDIYYVIYEYSNQACAMDFGYAAAGIVLALINEEDDIIEGILRRLQRLSTDSALGPSTRAIWTEARRRNIPVRRLGENSLLELGYGKHMRFIEASLPDDTSSIAVDLAKNKQLVKCLLQENQIPVPPGGIADSEEAAVVLAEQIGYPLTLKPWDGNQGRGVTVNIRDEAGVRKAYKAASRYRNRVIVEKHIEGKDYRVLVIGNQVVAVAERRPPSITGDGINTISELVELENQRAYRGKGHEKIMTEIHIDSVSREYLARMGFKPDDIPASEQVVCLRANGNLSTGGTARGCTGEIHPANKAMAVKAARIIGLEVAGIDMVVNDISQSMNPANGAIIEVNAAPGLRMHLQPLEGESRNVAADILDHMYPEGIPSSIPVISITGTNGKTTVTRLISHIISLTGKKVGMTCSSGTYIGKECISQGDNTGPISARSVLYNREVEVAVLETARGGIIRKGLAYDLAEVGIIVNISEDHLGLNGVNTLEDLAFVKSLVAEAVKPDGYVVLNADDNMTEAIMPRIKSNLILFSQDDKNPLIKQHIEKGERAVLVENGIIYQYTKENRMPLLGISEIPLTFEGRALCNIENCLAATAGLLALGLPESIIRLGLSSFAANPAINEGRFNLFNLGDFQVLLDYGHNPRAYQSVAQFASTLSVSRLVGVIGLPGDRTNQAIFQVGEISGSLFDKVYIKEDVDLRGRDPGEVAAILYHGAISGGVDPKEVLIMRSELEALQTAIDDARPGDLIIMFYEEFEPLWHLVQGYLDSVQQPISQLTDWPALIPVVGTGV